MLNEKFKMRMSALLGEEYEAFADALTKEAVRGLRVNTLKTSIDKIEGSFSENLIPLPYASDGFIIKNSSGIGNTPEHHAGMIYIQDPGAMATANALDILPGWKVLDMCSAPGGKSGQAAAKIGDSGFLLSNEYVPKRAKTVVSNFERLGVKNAIVTSLDTIELPKLFSGIFDLVIADVPCSGEGMFRKSDEAVAEWSEENVSACAQRQRKIIKNAVSLVKPGGYLLYSTCTYSLEENEMIIDEFLSENADFELVPVKKALADATRPGITFDGAKSKNLHLARRFYPHVSEGEGQFMALMKRRENSEVSQTILYKDASKPLSKDENVAIKRFFDTCLKHAPDGRITKVGDNIVILSHGFPIPPKSVFSAGVLAGTVEKGLFFPSHQFFSAYGDLFLKRENLKSGDARITKYLRGEEIEAKEISDGGFCVITYEGATLGGGKVSLGKIKNHYPKGLRIKN
jgi:NOL1/NOP2/sun family putative RNA methylase